MKSAEKKSADKELIKNYLGSLRKNLGLSQEAFGRPLNASRADVSRYEKGLHINLRLLLNIEKVYGFTFDQILKGKNLSATSNKEDEEAPATKADIRKLQSAIEMHFEDHRVMRKSEKNSSKKSSV